MNWFKKTVMKMLGIESELNKIRESIVFEMETKTREQRNAMLRREAEFTYPIGTKMIYSGNEPSSDIRIWTVTGYDDMGRILNENGHSSTGKIYTEWLHDLFKTLTWDKRYRLSVRNEHAILCDQEIARKNSYEYSHRQAMIAFHYSKELYRTNTLYVCFTDGIKGKIINVTDHRVIVQTFDDNIELSRSVDKVYRVSDSLFPITNCTEWQQLRQE